MRGSAPPSESSHCLNLLSNLLIKRYKKGALLISYGKGNGALILALYMWPGCNRGEDHENSDYLLQHVWTHP